jgi:hypothetical protein
VCGFSFDRSSVCIILWSGSFILRRAPLTTSISATDQYAGRRLKLQCGESLRLLIGFLLGTCLALGQAQGAPLEDAQRRDGDRFGRDVFEGRVSVVATMSGHSVPLPVEASRCRNCHSSELSPGQTRSFGTPLNPEHLTRATGRRGGPVSRYDVLSFCKVVREGIDPTKVVINSAMPRYVLSDAQCSSLWSYVMSRS